MKQAVAEGAAVSRIDWDAMVAGLERQRTGLEQELADVDAVIHAVRQRAAPKVSVAAITRPRANGKKPKPAAKAKAAKPAVPASGKLTPDQIVRMGELYEKGVAVQQLVERFKINSALVYYYAKSRKWKRPNPGVAASPAAASSAAPGGTQLSGSVKCTNPGCGAWTDYDPCRKCGKPLKRKGW